MPKSSATSSTSGATVSTTGPMFAVRGVTNTLRNAVVGNGVCSLCRVDAMLRVLNDDG